MSRQRPNSAERRVRLAACLIRALDACLRGLSQTREFTEDPECLLRLAKRRATEVILLPDGSCLRPGTVVGELHLWNEHVPRFTSEGPTLNWACRATRLARHSLLLLAEHVETNPAWRSVPAFYGDLPIALKRSGSDIARLAARYGFAVVHRRSTVWRVVHAALDVVLQFGLVLAFNPDARRRQRFRRHRVRIWIARSTLLQRYGTIGAPGLATDKAPAPTELRSLPENASHPALT